MLNRKQLDDLKKTFNQLNASISEMNRQQKIAATAANMQRRETEKLNKVEKELDVSFERRSKALTDSIKLLNRQGKAFELTNKASRKAFLEANKGANIFEFFDLALSSTNEQVKIFGLEAANARKIMYGFLPPGMFRAVNKLSTAFRTLGSITRKMKEGKEGSFLGNIGKIGKALPSFKNIQDLRYGEVIDKAPLMFPQMAGFDMGGQFKGKKRTFKGMMKQGMVQRKEAMKNMREGIKAFFANPKWKLAGKSFSLFAKGLGKALFKFVVMGTIYITLFFGLLWMFKGPIMKGFEFASKVVSSFLPMIIEGFSDVWQGISEIYEGLMQGDFIKMFGGMWEIIWGLLQISFGVFTGLISTVIAFIVGVAGKALEQGLRYVFNILSGTTTLKEKVIRILVIATIISAFIFGLPVILGAIVVGAVAGLLVKLGIKKLLDKIPFFANGGVSAGGLAVVGEKGPELVSLPRGSRVHSNANSRKMAGGTVNNFNITINAKDTSKAEMRRMADEIGRMINSKINRSTSSSTFR